MKEAKLQTYRAQFEGLNMKEDENIETYYLRVDEVVKYKKGVGEAIKDSIVIKKVLRTFSDRYDPKMSALEKSREMKTLKMDELQRILMSYEMRKEQDNASKHEAPFKE